VFNLAKLKTRLKIKVAFMVIQNLSMVSNTGINSRSYTL